MGNKETVKDLIFTGYHQVFRTQAHFTQNYDQRAQVCACECSPAEKHSCHLVQRRNTALAGKGMLKHTSIF